MLNCQKLFEGKKITVLGLGLLGRGLGDAEFLAKCGAHVLVTDKKTEAQLAESVEKLKHYNNVSFRLGGHDEKDFAGRDLVIKGAKTPLDSPYIAAARKAGVPVVMSTALFAKYAMEEGAIIVGITGTRGKSTVTHMIHYVLISAFAKASADRRAPNVILGGNIRGISTLAMLPEIKKGDIAVLELDSWQLQGFGDLQISPNISIFTNLMPDHLDYYQGLDAYFNDKANIFKFQKRGDSLFVGKGILEKVKATRPEAAPHVPPAIPADWKLQIPGEHNRENASLAAAALRSLGLQESDIQSGLESFVGLEGRLQLVGQIKGVNVYNDTNATTPEATVAALRAVGNAKNRKVVLIMGGDDKFLDMSALTAEIPKWCSKVVLFKERGTDRVRDEVFAMKSEGMDVYEEEGLPNTAGRAFSIAVPGETILFSPAFTSFGKYFKNEYDRGNQFMALVRAHTANG
ncbi:MAG: UDP-N-acetylmuramoyl-L-alanine--D-glutamate ligase [bacterium]|nr:UDP-N-acetylmuramoyl-L-alanine--D-glutamate ligase [bacterium]